MSIRVLIIVTERFSANGICALSVAKSMVERGDDVCCIVNREYGDDVSFVQDGIHFLTVRPRLVYAIGSMLGRKKEISHTKRKIYSVFSWVLNKIELFLSLPTWPVISRNYSKRIFESIGRVSEDKTLDLIIPIYTQIDTLVAANEYKKTYNANVTIIPYFLDSLAAGYGPKMMSKEWVEKRGLKWERKLLSDVNHIVMMKSSEEFYSKNRTHIPYFNKISFLDLPLFVPRERKCERIDKSKLELLYVGTIPGHIRNPKYFLDVFSQIEDPNVILTIIGPSTCEPLIKEYVNKDNRINRIQSVSHDEAIRRINEADILINLGNNITTMTPSKIFEYISTGKPIVSTAPINNEPCVPYLNRYGNSFIIYEDKPIDETVEGLKLFIKSAHNVNPKDLDNDFYLNQPKAFLEVIDKTINS